MPILDCQICNGTGWERKPKHQQVGSIGTPDDIGQPCWHCQGKGQVLQDSASYPCGTTATDDEIEDALHRNLKRI